MEENENIIENEALENEGGLVVQNFNSLNKASNTKRSIYTNITDEKKIFNLDNKVDMLLNDMENSIIEVKEVLIKTFEKPLKEPIVDEQTGEVLKEKETTMSCILIDKNNVSYATGSKVFTIQMMRYIQMFGIKPEGFMIKIVKKQQKLGKTLGFELV